METAAVPRIVAIGRIGFAGMALLTPKAATALIGGKPSQMNPMAMGWASGFASREAVVGALTLASEKADPATRRKVLLTNAFVDAMDTVSFVVLAKRNRTLLPIILAAPASVYSCISHLRLAQQLPAGTANGGATLDVRDTAISR